IRGADLKFHQAVEHRHGHRIEGRAGGEELRLETFGTALGAKHQGPLGERCRARDEKGGEQRDSKPGPWVYAAVLVHGFLRRLLSTLAAPGWGNASRPRCR